MRVSQPAVPKRARRGGFTLAELLIVAVLIAVVGSFAVGAFRRQSPSYRLERATARLVFDLQSARTRPSARTVGCA